MVLSISLKFLKHGDTLQLSFFIGGFIINPLHYIKLFLHVIALFFYYFFLCKIQYWVIPEKIHTPPMDGVVF